jgi:rhodanese-related sulfurtransferase
MNIKSSQDLVNEAHKAIETLDVSKVKSMLDNNECILIDVRDIRELWKEGTVKDSKHIPRGMLEFWLDPQSSYFKENKFDKEKKNDSVLCSWHEVCISYQITSRYGF